MIWRWGLVVLAVLGVAFGAFMVIRAAQRPEATPPLVTPDPIPFESYIAGAGIVESSSDDILIATPLSGVVDVVYVSESDEVREGTPLFRLDDRDYQAQLRLSLSELVVAKRQVVEAERQLEDWQNKLSLVEKLSDKRAISQQEVDNRRNAVRVAEARVATAQAEVERQEAKAKVIETDLHRLTVQSPIDGEVLQVNIHAGEFAQAGAVADPLMVLGTTSPLHVLVDIDENDAWRFNPEGSAVAVPRGDPTVQIPLRFVQVNPYIVPKRSLTGAVAERVDTRVLQVVYAFDKGEYPVYVGQQVDVSISTTSEEPSEDQISPAADASAV